MAGRGGRERVSAVVAAAVALAAGLAGAEAASLVMRLTSEPAGASASAPGRVSVTSASVPGALNAVSCTGPASCTAVGSQVSSGETVSLAESWNGSRWVVRPTPDPAGGAVLAFDGVSCGTADACLATGSYFLRGNLIPLAEWWNGRRWAAQTVPLPAGAAGGSLIADSCASATSCVATGSYTTSGGQSSALAESWQDGLFTIMPVPVSVHATASTLTAVSCERSAAAGCAAVGWDEMPHVGGAQGLTLGWNGTAWSVQATPRADGATASSFPGGVSCVAASACTSVGLGVTSAGHDQAWAQGWQGTGWANQAVPPPAHTVDGILSGVSCTSGGACSAVGYSSANGSVFTNFAELWNGTRWAVQRLPSPAGARSGDMTGVSCSSADACTGVGTVTNSAGTTVTLAERWNGSRWAVQQTPVP
jgi:hypothetical protein